MAPRIPSKGESECRIQGDPGVRSFRIEFFNFPEQEKVYVKESLVFDLGCLPNVTAGNGPGDPESRSVRRLLLGRRELSWLERLSHGKYHETLWHRCRL